MITEKNRKCGTQTVLEHGTKETQVVKAHSTEKFPQSYGIGGNVEWGSFRVLRGRRQPSTESNYGFFKFLHL